MDECWVEYGTPFHGKGPPDALGAAGKGGVNRGLAKGKLDCGDDSNTEVAKCVRDYMRDEHSIPEGWAEVRNIIRTSVDKSLSNTNRMLIVYSGEILSVQKTVNLKFSEFYTLP